MAPLKIAFLNLNSGPHGEYGALLAAAVASQDNVQVLSIVTEKLAASDRARVSLEAAQYRTIQLGGGLSRLAGLRKAWKILRDFRPDVIHEPAGSGTATVLPLRPFLSRLAPVVVTEHNPEAHAGMTGWHHGLARAITRRSAALIHVHGPKAFADMRKLGVPAQRLALVRHGAFDEYGDAARQFSRAGSKQILIFGALRPNKGIDMLPEILERVRAVHPDATLLITGKRPARIEAGVGGEMDIALDVLTDTTGCSVMNARVPEADIPRLFGECGLCLLPYRTATQSGVAMIAMSASAPLVATRVGDLPDVIEDGRTGLLAEPNPQAIAACIIAAFDDTAATLARADAAERFAREECAWPVIGGKMLAAYNDIPGLRTAAGAVA